MITDEMIRAAMHRVADTAPDGARVRAALAHRSRRYRQRRALLLAGGATAAVAAVAGPVALVVRRRPVRIEAGLPNLADPAAPPEPAGGNSFVPLRWRPTWLPEGYVEVSRTVTASDPAGGLQVRSWWRVGSGSGPAGGEDYLHLHAGPTDWFGDQSWRRPATVNGAPGGLAHEPGQVSQVVWQPTPGEMLAVGVTASGLDAIEVAERIAGSVVADGLSGCELPLVAGWLPDGVAGDHVVTVDTDELGDLRVQLRVQPPDRGMSLVDAVMGTSVHRPGGWEPVTVRDLPGVGRVAPDPDDRVPAAGAEVPIAGPSGWVHVELADARQLFLSLELSGLADPPELALADVVRVAESLHIGPDPDTSWLGHR